MKTYAEYEKEYENAVKSAKNGDYTVKKELWIGFKLCDDENMIPAPTEEFINWFESLEEQLNYCVASTIQLANQMRDSGIEITEIS